MPQKDTYRKCASLVVFKPSGVCSPEGCSTLYQMLLVHKPRKRDAWQIPQGGQEEGESLEQAALRELKEEAGIDADIVGKSNEVYQYNFPESFRRFRPDNVCGQRIEFVFAVAESDAQIVVDEDEIDEFVWVLPEEIARYIKREDYLNLVRKLYKEGISVIGITE